MSETSCNIPPRGWKCTRGAEHDGPCAAHPALECKFGTDCIKRLGPHSTAQHFLSVHGYKIGFFNRYQEVLDAVNRDAAQGGDGIVFTKGEALLLQKLVRGVVVGPSVQKALDKLNAVKE